MFSARIFSACEQALAGLSLLGTQRLLDHAFTRESQGRRGLGLLTEVHGQRLAGGLNLVQLIAAVAALKQRQASAE